MVSTLLGEKVQKKAGGRPRKKLNQEQKIQVEALAACLSQEQIADYFGMGKTTWYALLERDPEVFERYKRGKAQAISDVANGLLQMAKAGDTASAIFYLKTQAGWRETNRTELTGADGSPLGISVQFIDS